MSAGDRGVGLQLHKFHVEKIKNKYFALYQVLSYSVSQVYPLSSSSVMFVAIS